MQSSEKATLKKVIEEKSSKEQARQTVDWISSSIEGQQALSEMIDRDAYLVEDEFLNVKISSVQSDKILSNILRDIRRKHILKVTFSVAAVVIPLVLLLGWVVLSNPDVQIFGNPTYAEIYVPRGDNARIFFQDGTQAYLNADTKIRYPKKFGLFKRKVFLSGEAYFIVS
nr:anti-sigma factor [Dysgonamonadaceae bacterium]